MQRKGVSALNKQTRDTLSFRAKSFAGSKPRKYNLLTGEDLAKAYFAVTMGEVGVYGE